MNPLVAVISQPLASVQSTKLDQMRADFQTAYDAAAYGGTYKMDDPNVGETVLRLQSGNPGANYDAVHNANGSLTLTINRPGGAITALGYRVKTPRVKGRTFKWSVDLSDVNGAAGYVGPSLGFDPASQGETASPNAAYFTARHGFAGVEDVNNSTLSGYTVTLTEGAHVIPSGYAGGDLVSCEYTEREDENGDAFGEIVVTREGESCTYSLKPLPPGHLVFSGRSYGSDTAPWGFTLYPPSWVGPAPEPSENEAPAVNSDPVIHVGKLGQSLATGDESKPALTIAATDYGSLMLGVGIATWSISNNPTAPQSRTGNFDLVPMVSGDVETSLPAFADAYKARHLNFSKFTSENTETGPSVVATMASLGGHYLSQLGPDDVSNEGFWVTTLDDISRVKAAADAQGRPYHNIGLLVKQGEKEGGLRDEPGGPVKTPSEIIATYTARVLALASNYNAEVKARAGKTKNTPVIATPATSNILTPTAWLDASKASPLVFVTGPTYQMSSALTSDPVGDGIHLDPDSQRWVGELDAKVMSRIAAGEDWKPMHVMRAVKSGPRTIDLDIHIPCPPLRIDTDTFSTIRGFGFIAYGGSLDAPVGRQYADSVDILPGGGGVRLTFPADIPAGALLDIGAVSILEAGQSEAITAVTATTLNGEAATAMTIAGNAADEFDKLMRTDGVMYAYSDGPSQMVVRKVEYVGGNTVLTGLNTEVRTTDGRVPFQAGQSAYFGGIRSRTNLRDSDSVLSIGTFQRGPRLGQPYPLQNWLCQYAGLPVSGA